MISEELKRLIKNKKVLLSYLIILTLFFFLVVIQINKPLRGEQDYWAYDAHKIVDGERKLIYSFEGYGLEKISGIVHPPLYAYSVAFFIKLFGYNLIALKLSSIIFTILTSFLLLIMGFYFFPENKKLALFAVFLFLIHPIVINNSLLLDMDGGILVFVSLLTIFMFMKYKLEKPFLLGFFIFLGLWIKFTIFVILFSSFFIYIFIKKDKKFITKDKISRLIKLFLIFFTSFLIFILIFYIYAQWSGNDFFQPFKHNSSLKFKNRFSEGIFINFLRIAGGLKAFVIWINPPIILLSLIVFLRDFKKIIKSKIDTRILLMYIIIIIAIGFHTITGVAVGSTGKYIVFVMPLISLIIVKEFSRFVNLIKSKKIIFLLVALGIIITEYYLIFLGDPLLVQDTWMVFSQFSSSLVFSIALKILIILIPLILLYVVFRKNFIFLLIFLIVLLSVYSSFYTSFAKYSTNYNYGDYGLEESVDYLRKLTRGENATIIAERGITFMLGNGSYLDEKKENAYVYVASQYYIYVEKFYNGAIIVKNNTYLAIYEHNLYRTPSFRKHLESHFSYLTKIGYYRIYKIKEN